jgi:methanogenic corrinoid protein MtbC1
MKTSERETLAPSESAHDHFCRALMRADRVETRAEMLKILAENADPFHIVECLIIPALARIGSEWAEGRAALSQVYISGRICEALVDELLPPQSEGRKTQSRMCIAALHDRHLLGKRLVHSVLRAAGYALSDYGSVSVAELVDKVRADRIDVVLISTLMLASALKVAEVRSALDREGLHPFIIVGGAPFRLDPRLWREVGADAMGATSSDVLPIVAQFEKDSP